MLLSLSSYQVWKETEPLKQRWLQSVHSLKTLKILEDCSNPWHRGRNAQTELLLGEFVRFIFSSSQRKWNAIFSPWNWSAPLALFKGCWAPLIRFCFVNASCSVQSQCLKLLLLYDLSEKPEKTSEDVFPKILSPVLSCLLFWALLYLFAHGMSGRGAVLSWLTLWHPFCSLSK